MSSSTSDSERRFVRSALAAFIAGAALLLVPFEIAVRRSEAKYGVQRANITEPLGLPAKVDAFFAEIDAGHRFATYIVGTSQVQEGIRPDVIEPVAGPTYNLGMEGISAIVEMEMLERLGVEPKHLIVGVSPMDFIPLAVARGQKAISHADELAIQRRDSYRQAPGPASASRRIFYAAIHGARPQRKRNVGQWAEFFRNGGTLLPFLNHEHANRREDLLWMRGYVGRYGVASSHRFAERGLTIAAEYAEGHEAMMARFAAVILRFRARGAEVVLVQLPISPGMRQWEAEATTFARDLPKLVQRCGTPYIDGDALMGPAFVSDRRNFSDPVHLNVPGSTAFTARLAAAIDGRARVVSAGSAARR